MERYKYRAINEAGRPVKGVMAATNEADLGNQLNGLGMELIDCTPLMEKKGGGSLPRLSLRKPVDTRDLIQFYIQLEQVQSAGVPLLTALTDMRDTADNDALRDTITEIHRDISEGNSLSEAIQKHERIFSRLDVALIAAAEETGDLTKAYSQLVDYHKWREGMQIRVKKATRYPIILLIVVLLTISVMMGFVVPQVVGFIEFNGQELPFYTKLLMAVSGFFVKYWWAVFGGIAFVVGTIVILKKTSEDMAYKFDAVMLKLPIMGEVVRKINTARFAQTFGALFSSGIDVIKCLQSARNTVDNRVIREALEDVEKNVKAGAALSEAFQGHFPTMIVRMVKVGEESGNLTVVMDQVSEFYTSDVDETVQGMISMLEPLMISILGIMVLWIAVAIFGPIYGSFENLNI